MRCSITDASNNEMYGMECSMDPRYRRSIDVGRDGEDEEEEK